MSNPNVTWRSIMKNSVITQRKGDAVASSMFFLARKCNDVNEFLANCENQELWVKSEEAGQDRLERIPVCWQQAKSDIKAAFERGLELSDYPTYSQMKKAKVEAGKPAPATAKAAFNAAVKAQGKDKPDAAEGPKTMDQALADGDVVDSNAALPADLRELVKFLQRMTEMSRARTVKRITAIAKDIHDAQHESFQRGKEAAANA